MPHRTADLEIKLLLEALFQRYHYDFRGYSMASLKRRLTQARDQMGCESFSMLQHRILHDPVGMTQLLPYLTVHVSEFFRDPKYFLAIREEVVPHLKTFPSIKVWIAGCSTGEEAYSLAILFREEGLEQRTMFYGTDIDPDALRKAETGVYSLDRIAEFTTNHVRSGGKSSLSNYYTADYGAAVFDKSLRQRMVFSDHSLATDSVFAEMHLISCRNVLIYFDRPLQDRAIGLFSESLARNGFLGLGARESLRFSQHVGDFTEFRRDERIYRRRGTP